MIKEYNLENGTRVIHNRDYNSASVSCYAYFPLGVATETDCADSNIS